MGGRKSKCFFWSQKIGTFCQKSCFSRPKRKRYENFYLGCDLIKSASVWGDLIKLTTISNTSISSSDKILAVDWIKHNFHQELTKICCPTIDAKKLNLNLQYINNVTE